MDPSSWSPGVRVSPISEDRADGAFASSTQPGQVGDPDATFLLRETSDAVMVVDADGRVLQCNRAAERLLGRTRQELLDTDHSELLPPAVRRLETGALEAVIRTSTPDRYESMRLNSSGTAVPVSVSIGRGADPDTALYVLHDLSVDRDSQRELAEAAQRLQAVQELARAGLWVWDLATDEVQWTPMLLDLHGIDPMDFAATLDAHLSPVDPSHRSKVERALQQARAGGQDVSIDYPIRLPSGHVRWLTSRMEAVVKDGEIVGVQGVCVDITSRQAAKQALEQTNDALARFAHEVAHDLKEPLTSLRGFIEYLPRADEEDRPLIIERLEANAERMVQLIEDMLRTAEGGGSSEQVSLTDLVARACDHLQEQIERVHARITADELPTVTGDEVSLRQVLVNLIGNALKYRHAERTPVIEISAERTRDRWQIRVADNGPGIPVTDRERVFETGVRLSGADDGGHGLGLSTCRAVIERHGGSIGIEDGIAGGTAVVISLPVEAVKAPTG